ncbi:hypothetical protein SESBI_40102 [Sesbania bispinosa]|nr:hypothetical protein SESBI_40102 [Sesbania bispinosa]
MDFMPRRDLTPLNTKRSEILREVYNSELLEAPLPTKYPKGPHKDRWCEFHRVKGRNKTDSNKQGGRGRGRGYVPQPQIRDNLGEQTEEIRGTVTMIAGGFVGGGDTSSARRRYNRSVMQISEVQEEEPRRSSNPLLTFSDEDFKGIAPHEHDPMRGAWEEGDAEPLEKVYLAELDPRGNVRDDRRP